MVKSLLACVMLVLLSGCAQGVLYSHTVQPLTTNFHVTPVGSDKGKASTKQISVQVQAKWDVNGIGQIAKENNLQQVYFADIEVQRIMRFWERRTVHVYGQ